MILNIAVIVLTGIIALMWGLRGKGRGFFSAFLALVCTIIAGAVAFAAWEPLAYGVFLGLKEEFAWGLSLIAPFVATLIVTRLLVEVLIPKNVRLGDTENFIGGFLCGAANGVLTVGIAVLAISFYSGGPEIAGHSPVEGERGNLVYKRQLWLPVDRITVGFYEALSLHGFSSSTPLARRAPRLYEQAAMSRQVFVRDDSEGNRIARSTILPDQFSVKGQYIVEQVEESIVYPDGSEPPENPVTHGFAIEFRTQGGEQGSGQVVIGNGQVRLIARSDEGRGDSVVAVHPFAIIGTRQDGLGVHRWVFDAQEIFIGSVGGADSSMFMLEFAVPQGFQPTDLFVKNVRVPLAGSDRTVPPPGNPYATAAARDRAITDGTLFTALGVSMSGATQMTVVDTGAIAISPSGSGWVNVFPGLPENWVLSGVIGTGGLATQERLIRNGTATFSMDRLTDRAVPVDQRVDTFTATRDTIIVQVRLASQGTFTVIGEAISQSPNPGQPVIVDENGRAYPAIGFIYGTEAEGTISFTPSNPIMDMGRLPATLSPARGNQTAYLIFRPTTNVNLVGFGFRGEGNTVNLLVRFNPALPARR